MAVVYLSVGSNKGDRIGNVRAAISALAPHVSVERVSSVYETEPMYRAAQSRFYNLALKGTTSLAPIDLLAELKRIEREIGRQERKRNAEREIDIDILLFDDVVLDTPHLTIPHPRLHERAFVVVPLHEIDPLLEHPVSTKPVIELWDELRGGRSALWPAAEQV